MPCNKLTEREKTILLVLYDVVAAVFYGWQAVNLLVDVHGLRNVCGFGW